MAFRQFAALVLAASALAAACPTGAQAQQKVVIYTANDDALNNLAFDAFNKESGIKVEPISAGSGVVFKRIQAEKERPQGDVVWGVSRSLLQSNKEYFAPYKSVNLDAIPPEFRDPDNLWIGNNVHLAVILENTKALAGSAGPKSWNELLDPKWKGKIAFTDPANSGSAYTTTTLLVDLWGGGEKGWSKLKELFANLKVLNRSSLVFEGVGNGEYPLGISLEYAGYVWAHNGAPVTVVYPSDGTVPMMEGCAVIKGGPNPEAAKKFVDWVNRKDVREMILKSFFRRPARQDLALTQLTGSMPTLASLKILNYDEAGWTAKRKETLERIRDLVQETR
ncbi:MAG: extracellular solute-binding protein [Alphaproteobacteria bacterium]